MIMYKEEIIKALILIVIVGFFIIGLIGIFLFLKDNKNKQQIIISKNFQKIKDNYNEKLKNNNRKDIYEPMPNLGIKKEKRKKSNYQKGKEYEEQIGKYYENIGYHVIYHGIEKGKKDKGIDLIATRENKTLLIQCKNWENSIVKQKDIKEFIGNCSLFLEHNNIKALCIKKIFITSNQNTDYGVKKFMQENHKSIEYKIIPYIANI